MLVVAVIVLLPKSKVLVVIKATATVDDFIINN